MATSTLAAGPVHGDEQQVFRQLPAPIYVDDPAALELANKLGLNQAPKGGLRGVTCDPVGDATNCHPADLTLGANFSGAAAGSFRTMDNFTPTTSNPTELCWIGRYANRVDPIANESFSVKIYADNAGFPDLGAGPIFERTFSENGTAGTDQLELTCLDSCPGTTDPVAGGHWVFSAAVSGGFPVNGNSCYWIEIANVGTNGGGCTADWNDDGIVNSNDISSYLTAWLADVQNGTTFANFNGDGVTNSNDISAFLTAWLDQIGDTCGAGVNWGWVGSTGGTDLTSLQAIDGAYTTFTRVANDRSFCFNGGMNPFLGGCTIEPLPPICPNDMANGIPDVGGANNGFRASAPGSIGRPQTPGAWTPFQRAEEFTYSADTTVDSVCFGGFWLGVTDAGGTIGIAAPDTPAFNVTYFVHDYDSGLPGMTPVASFNVGDAGVTLQWDGDDIAHISHPPVNFTAGTCYYVSIGNLQVAQAPGQPVTPLWHWFLTNSSTPTGNDLIHSRAIDPTTAWGSFTLVPTNPSNLWFLLSSGGLVTPDCPPPPPPPVPANDLCADAVAIPTPSVGNPSTVNGTTLGALDDTAPDCTLTGSSAGGVWYTVVGTGAQMTASMCNTVGGYDGQIGIYSGGCDALACVAGNDDGCGAGGVSIASWPSTAGTVYHIRVYGWGGATGDFQLDVSTN